MSNSKIVTAAEIQRGSRDDEVADQVFDLLPRELRASFTRSVFRDVARSFNEGAVIVRRTRDEERRRVRLLLDGFKHMCDLGYTPFRAADEMYGYLDAKLKGLPWEPRQAGGMWGGPDDRVAGPVDAGSA